MIQLKYTDLAKRLLQEKNIDVTPRRATDGSVGFDIFACIENPISIAPGETVKIPSGVHIYIGELFIQNLDLLAISTITYVLEGQCVPRSSIPSGIRLVNTVGTLDYDYQGEWICKYRNDGKETQVINSGDRWTQMIFRPVLFPEFKVVEEFEQQTNRNDGGFGSTGR